MASSSGNAGPSGSTPKAIASLAKKQSDVTRLGTQKLKFVPTLPARRKKEDIKKVRVVLCNLSRTLMALPQRKNPWPLCPPQSAVGAAAGSCAWARTRAGWGGQGRRTTRAPVVEMTASGPFAMGPALAGTSARRTAPRSNFAPIVPQGPGASSRLGAGLTQTTAPTLKREKEEHGMQVDDEVYSDPDEGVEIVDMDNVRQMDWMAPESLKKESEVGKKKKGLRLKKEEEAGKRKGKAVKKGEVMDVDEDVNAAADEEVNMANAVDLSESEEEEELEDIIDDFALAQETEEESNIRQERLYFFQFPKPFPTFLSHAATPDIKGKGKEEQEGAKKVTFAQDTKPPAASTPGPPAGGIQSKAEEKQEDPKVDGIIGQLEVYESGTVKMRFGNDILLDVTAATQPSFLQHAVYLDPTNKRLCVLGK
ncbi:hypothetical protein A0H81_06054 [Grifola frondosa]|uniref:DNA-directed RNA polymerase III subunit RPC4 n=1 Tax=Grifola frondosa TaxID=5627 RepID=A0A1C7MB04_GRIFR|nr:hypothetical protein A0H81_06054 [Grifola frondosa]